MTRSKLSASDREELIRLFKETTETITSLANQFQVSISTARRVLKTQLSAEEYETIVTNRLEGRHHKRTESAPKPSSKRVITSLEPDIIEDEAIEEDTASESPTEKTKVAPPIPRPKRRSRRRSTAEDDTTSTAVENADTLDQSVTDDPTEAESSVDIESSVDTIEPSPTRPTKGLRQREERASTETSTSTVSTETPLEVFPIEAAVLPNQCYLVVDRASELITPPLREFAELGDIPSSEESAKTLPIFENHKIASRFSRRSQRIIKVPNSDILKKTYALLTAKGVERILFDGQVFSLSNRQS